LIALIINAHPKMESTLSLLVYINVASCDGRRR
jgi:hypothetical protein